jgi:hypothetical protein
MNRKLHKCFFLAVLFLMLTCYLPTFGQVTKGSISGSVTDSSGAVIAGAAVKATEVDTGEVYPTKTDGAGLFRLSFVPVGRYRLEITAQGFKTDVQNGISITAGADTGVGSIKLSVGSNTETIEVAAEAPLIETSQAQVTNTFSGTMLQNFAGIQENEGLDRLALFVPGVVNSRSDNFSNTNGVGFSTSGLRGRNNDQEIDGQNNNDNSVGGASLFVTDVSFVQQYVLITNNFGPEFGRNGGSVVNVITGSGTNLWHGTIYGDENNSFLNALSNLQRNSNNPATGQPFTGPPRSNTEFTGFTIGGPVLKNKVFLFGGFDDQITAGSGVFASGLQTPTQAGLAELSSCPAVDPAALHALNTLGPYAFSAGNPQPFGGLINTTFASGPLAGCSDQTSGVIRTLPTPARAFNWVQKVDAQLGGSDSFSGRYLLSRNNVFNRNDNAAAGYVFNQSAFSQAVLLTETHNFSSRMVNEARIGFDRLNVGFGGNTIGNIFEPTPGNQGDGSANIAFLNGTMGFGTGVGLPQGRVVNTWQLQDNWNYVLGKHQLKAGVNFTDQISPNIFLPGINGQFIFNDLTNFLVNQPELEFIAAGPNQGFKEYDTFLYFGDDWKISQHLTLNLGLTWTYYGNPSNVFNQVSTARESNPATALWASISPLNGEPVPLAARTVPAINNVYNSFGPSIGFAYSPQWGGFVTGHGKTTIRGGYRLLYDPPFYNIFSNVATSAPFITTPTIAGPLIGGPGPQLPANPTGVNTRAVLSPFTQPGVSDPRSQTELTLPSNFGPDKVNSWSFGFEREITKNSAFEARYVGNHAWDVFQAVNGNPFFTDLQTQFPNLVPSGLTACSNPNQPAQFQGRPNCNFGLLQQYSNGAYSNYNALQLEFRANNLFRQLTVRTGYTWSKTLDNTSEIFGTGTAGNTQAFAQNPTQTGSAEYSISGLSVPNAWTLTLVEQLPFFKEQHGFLSHVLGGWSFSGDYILASGQPYTPLQTEQEELQASPNNFYDAAFIQNFVGTGTARPFAGSSSAPINAVGIFAGDCPLLGFNCSSVSNTTLVSLNMLNSSQGGTVTPVNNNQVHYIINAPTAEGIFGTPFGNVARNLVTDAPQNIMNFSVYKTFKLGERAHFEMHATALNALNHFNFGSVDPALEHAGLGGIPGEGTGFALPFVSGANGRTLFIGGRVSF